MKASKRAVARFGGQGVPRSRLHAIANCYDRIDEIYVRVRGEWKYLYCDFGSAGNTIEFMLSAKRDN